MSLPDLDILEVKSVSDMISVFETPADDAAKLIGEDDVAIFSPQLDLMIVTSQYDLEEPVTTSQTVILSVADAECTWPDPPEYVSDIVFECRWPSGANLVTEFQTFSDENATPSASLEYYRKRFAEGGTCMVFSEYDEAYLLDLKGKRHASRVDNQDGTPIAGKRPAADTASPADLAHRAAPPTASDPAARRSSEPTAAFRSCVAASTSSTTTGCPISAWRSMPPNTSTCRTGSSLPERKEHSPCLPRWTASSPETRRAPRRSS